MAAAAAARGIDWALAGVDVAKMTLERAFSIMLEEHSVCEVTHYNDGLRVGRLLSYFPKGIKVGELSGAHLRQLSKDWLRPKKDVLAKMTAAERKEALSGRVGDSSVRQYLAVISKTYRILQKSRDYNGPNPAKNVVWPAVDRALNHEERYIPDDVLANLLRTARRLESEGWTSTVGKYGSPRRFMLKPGSTTLFGFLAVAGTRLSEAQRITVRGAQEQFLSINFTKNGNSRTIPRLPAITRVLERRLEEMRDYVQSDYRLWHEIDSPNTKMDTRQAWNVLMKEMDINYRLHDLRHTAVSNLFLKTDLRDQEIMLITGHLSPSVMARYAHLRSAKLAERCKDVGLGLEF